MVHGPIEQTSYGDAGVAKWDQLGERVYSSSGHDGLGYTPFLMQSDSFIPPVGVHVLRWVM